MINIERILQSYSTNNDIEFRLGSKSHLNLLEGREELTEDKVHLLLFPVRRGIFDRSTNSRIVNGNFFLVMPDNFDRHYFNEREQPENESKFVLKIEPLQDASKRLEVYLSSCGEVDVITFDSVDAIDVLDANLTGLFITFQMRVYE